MPLCSDEPPTKRAKVARGRALYVMRVWGHDRANAVCEDWYGVDEAFALVGSYPSWLVEYAGGGNRKFKLQLSRVEMGDVDVRGFAEAERLMRRDMRYESYRARRVHIRWSTDFKPDVPHDPTDQWMYRVHQKGDRAQVGNSNPDKNYVLWLHNENFEENLDIFDIGKTYGSIEIESCTGTQWVTWILNELADRCPRLEAVRIAKTNMDGHLADLGRALSRFDHLVTIDLWKVSQDDAVDPMLQHLSAPALKYMLMYDCVFDDTRALEECAARLPRLVALGCTRSTFTHDLATPPLNPKAFAHVRRATFTKYTEGQPLESLLRIPACEALNEFLCVCGENNKS